MSRIIPTAAAIAAGVVGTVIGGPAVGIAAGLAIGGGVASVTAGPQHEDNTSDHRSVTDGFNILPYCSHRAFLFYESNPPEAVVLTFAVSLDHKSFVKPFEDNMYNFGTEKLTFRFKFTSRGERDGSLKLTGFTEEGETVNGWTVTPLIPPIINESHVYDYCHDVNAQPPYIQVAIRAHQSVTGFEDQLRHTLNIEGISSVASTAGASDKDWAKIEIKTSLSEILHPGLKSNKSFFKQIDHDYLKKAFESGRVKATVSKAIIQGPARTGKTSLRCLITGKCYESNKSTSCIVAPCVAIHKYGSYDGTCWKFVSDDEMLTEAVRICKYYEEQKSPVATEHTSGTSTTTSQRPLQSSGKRDTSISQSYNKQSKPQKVASELIQKIKDKMLDSVIDKPDHDKTIHKKWLYFIDSGGQIQFQQLLHAFLPCASVLLLVTNLAEGFFDQSSTKMQLADGARNVSEYSPTNEALMEQLIIMVDACSEQQREIIRRDRYLGEIIKPPNELHVMTIATHLDVFEELAKTGKVTETIESKQKKFNQILRSLKDAVICPNLHNSEIFYTIDVPKAMGEGDSQDTVVKRICEELRNQAFEIDIPLRWYAFEILLRKTAESFHGILTLDDCKYIGSSELNMESKEVESALKFFHLLNTMLYYPESKAKDLIFALPQHLFDVITELAILICKIRNKENIGGVTTRVIKFADVGIFSKDFIAISETSKKIQSNIPDFGSKLLLLFDYLSIAKTVPAAEYGEEMFFMPALLPLNDPSTVSQSADCPFVFHFKKSAPMGFFCSFIIYLLSSHYNEEEDADWLIPPLSTRISSNYIILRGRRLGMSDIRFLEYRDRYEIYCDEEKYRIALRKQLTEAMRKLVKEREIGFYKRPEPALYCPCDRSDVPHVATIKTVETLSCTVKLKLVKCTHDNTSHSCWSWLSNTSAAATIANKGICTFSEALLQHRLNEEPEHTELVNKLSSMDYQWEELGIALGVERRALESLRNVQSNTLKLEGVMMFWRDKLSPPYTWATILDIISGDVIKNKRLRSEIENFLGAEKDPPTQSADDVNPSTEATEKLLEFPSLSLCIPAIAEERPVPNTAAQPAESMTILKQNKALLKDYTVDQVADFLDNIGLGEYKEIFKEWKVNGKSFFELTEEELDDPDLLNITNKLHQKMLMKYVNGVKLIRLNRNA